MPLTALDDVVSDLAKAEWVIDGGRELEISVV
jgi:hypothetical protein